MSQFIIQIRYAKRHLARFLSHREIMTFMERAVRRAGIPVQMSEGFNPKPRLSFPTALGLGIESEDEVIYLTLEQWLNPKEIARRLQVQLLPGIELISAEPVISGKRPVVNGIEYEISFTAPQEMPGEETVNRFLNQPTLLAERIRHGQAKTVDIKRFIKSLRIVNDRTLSLSVYYSTDGSASPSEVLTALGLKEGLMDGKIRVRKLKTLCRN